MQAVAVFGTMPAFVLTIVAIAIVMTRNMVRSTHQDAAGVLHVTVDEIATVM